MPGGGVWSSKHTEIIRESAEGLSVATVIIQRQQTDLIRTGWSSRGGDAHTHTHKKTNEKKKPLIKSLRRVSVQKVNYYIMFPLLELQLCSWHLLMSTRVCVCVIITESVYGANWKFVISHSGVFSPHLVSKSPASFGCFFFIFFNSVLISFKRLKSTLAISFFPSA